MVAIAKYFGVRYTAVSRMPGGYEDQIRSDVIWQDLAPKLDPSIECYNARTYPFVVMKFRDHLSMPCNPPIESRPKPFGHQSDPETD